MRSPQTAVAVAMLVTLAGTVAVAAQELKLRTIQGRVVDEQNRAVASAVVYLRDDRTNSVRTYITNSSGHYRFSWLGEYDEYELEAQTKTFQSHRHTISQWDTRREFAIDLKLDKKQG
jgi:Carboxypeptidase regulatory-like domain